MPADCTPPRLLLLFLPLILRSPQLTEPDFPTRLGLGNFSVHTSEDPACRSILQASGGFFSPSFDQDFPQPPLPETEFSLGEDEGDDALITTERVSACVLCVVVRSPFSPHLFVNRWSSACATMMPVTRRRSNRRPPTSALVYRSGRQTWATRATMALVER